MAESFLSHLKVPFLSRLKVPLQCQASWGQSYLENTAPALGFNIFPSAKYSRVLQLLLAHLVSNTNILNKFMVPSPLNFACPFIHLLLDKIASQILNLECFFGSNCTQITDIHIFYNRILLFADSWQKFTQLNGSWAVQNNFVRPHTTKNVSLHSK